MPLQGDQKRFWRIFNPGRCPQAIAFAPSVREERRKTVA
jgi:hypothetical protein